LELEVQLKRNEIGELNETYHEEGVIIKCKYEHINNEINNIKNLHNNNIDKIILKNNDELNEKEYEYNNIMIKEIEK
jgi:hypothetical protein